MIFNVISKMVPLGSCFVCMDIGSSERLAMQNFQIPDTAETILIPIWLFPPCFPGKSRFTFSRPESVLVAPISARTKKQQASYQGGWVLRSGRGQLRENGSTSAALPAATSRSIFSRQHRPKHLSILQRDIHLIEIKNCEDTQSQNQLRAAQEQHKGLCSTLQGASITSTPYFWVWVAPSTTIIRLGLLRSWVLILREFRNLLLSFMFILSITLPNMSIPDVPFPALLSTLIRRRFQVKPATLLISIDDFSFWWRVSTVPGTVPKWLLSLNYCGVFFTACYDFISLGSDVNFFMLSQTPRANISFLAMSVPRKPNWLVPTGNTPALRLNPREHRQISLDQFYQ